MIIKKGIPVSPGVAISQAVVLDAEDAPVTRRTVPAAAVPGQLQRLQKALDASIEEVKQLATHTTDTLGSELGRIFDFHLGMLSDKSLTGQFRAMIEREHVSAEYAVFSVMREEARKFSMIENKYLRDRVKDVWDIERRVLRHLLGVSRTDLAELKTECIVIAHDLTPSQTASLDKDKIKAIATDAGGRTSHTAILAHALGIPSIVGLEDVTASIRNGDTVIIDGNRGIVIIEPDAAQLLEYRQELQRMARISTSLDELADLPAETTDGVQITLHANIEFPAEIDAALLKGATGIGLYRTEFLFLSNLSEPDEEVQFAAYQDALQRLDGRMLTIRTLDLGADKMLPHDFLTPMNERNPFLGCRSIRLCLQNLPLFKTQLRAILRASALGNVRILFPLISNLLELRQAKMILSDVMEDLDDQGIKYASSLPVGIMVEVPSVAIQASAFCREVDFLSIGTNDLIQYTVAVDRGNERIASLYSAAHPSVLQLIKDVVRSGTRAKVGVSLCGEMGGEPEYVMLLVGLGLRSLSITPPAIPEVKKIIRSVSVKQCQRVARRAMSFETDREVINYLRDEVRRVNPGIFDGRSIEA